VSTSHNPYLLTAAEEAEIKAKHQENKQRLRVPRRPEWHKDMSKEELERRERGSFLEWRRGVAE
jgi:large subunit GTPase 1